MLTERPLGPELFSCMEDLRVTLRGVTGERQLPSRRLLRNGEVTVDMIPKDCDLERENPVIVTNEKGLRILILQLAPPHWMFGKKVGLVGDHYANYSPSEIGGEQVLCKNGTRK